MRRTALDFRGGHRQALGLCLSMRLATLLGCLPHSFQGSFFLENLRKPRENARFLERTMVEKNGSKQPLEHWFNLAEEKHVQILWLCSDMAWSPTNTFHFSITTSKRLSWYLLRLLVF